VLGRQRLAGLGVGDARRRFYPAARPGRHHDDTGDTRFDDGFEVMLNSCHGVA
jgi:hypothetical protein